MKSIESLYEALQEDRAGFIKGLIAAGFIDSVVYDKSGNDADLVGLALDIYNDLWDAFNKSEFESWVYRFA